MKSILIILLLLPFSFTINAQISENIALRICEGDSYEGYTETGIYKDTFNLNSGFDSIRILELIVEPFQEFTCKSAETI